MEDFKSVMAVVVKLELNADFATRAWGVYHVVARGKMKFIRSKVKLQYTQAIQCSNLNFTFHLGKGQGQGHLCKGLLCLMSVLPVATTNLVFSCLCRMYER